MKFQCGKCGKNYLVDNAHMIDKTLTLECTKCGTGFFIRDNLSFSSSCGSSKIICENCGQLVNEKSRVCPSCGLMQDKQHEASRIDNKEYEALVVHDGKICRKHTENKRTGKGLPAAAVIMAVVSAGAAAFWFFSTPQHTLKETVLQPIADLLPKKHGGKMTTQVVIMMSGQHYLADKVEYDGQFVHITGKNGSAVTVEKKNILQIAEAVIED